MYTVDETYVDYLSSFSKVMFHNSKPNQKNSRKYIGIVMTVHSMDYFIPLSSFKKKHYKMKESLDFIKLHDYSVININNMFPVPEKLYTKIDFSKEKDKNYVYLLRNEYRLIQVKEKLIRKNAKIVYKIKTNPKDNSSLSKRCNDFLLLEQKAKEYHY